MFNNPGNEVLGVFDCLYSAHSRPYPRLLYLPPHWGLSWVVRFSPLCSMRRVVRTGNELILWWLIVSPPIVNSRVFVDERRQQGRILGSIGILTNQSHHRGLPAGLSTLCGLGPAFPGTPFGNRFVTAAKASSLYKNPDGNHPCGYQ